MKEGQQNQRQKRFPCQMLLFGGCPRGIGKNINESLKTYPYWCLQVSACIKYSDKGMQAGQRQHYRRANDNVLRGGLHAHPNAERARERESARERRLGPSLSMFTLIIFAMNDEHRSRERERERERKIIKRIVTCPFYI